LTYRQENDRHERAQAPAPATVDHRGGDPLDLIAYARAYCASLPRPHAAMGSIREEARP
jgi:hypothetical protein